jgi:hypothetical protein
VVRHGEDDHQSSLNRPPTEVKGSVIAAYTWGIGGPRVGRPSRSEPFPAAPVEGILESVIDISASGHTAVVVDSGRILFVHVQAYFVARGLVTFYSLNFYKEITDAYGKFHTDVIAKYSGVKDINASYYI